MFVVYIKENDSELDIQVHIEENLENEKLQKIENALNLLSKQIRNYQNKIKENKTKNK